MGKSSKCKQTVYSPIDNFATKVKVNTVSVIVPVYNEVNTVRESIENLIEACKGLWCKFEVIVVESNSSDGSRELLRGMSEIYPVKIFEQSSPEGKGSAVRLGLEKSIGDVILIYDADLEYSANDIPTLLCTLEEGNSSFILGARNRNPFKIREFRNQKFLSYLLNLGHYFFLGVFNIVMKTSLKDPFTMYKVFRREIFEGVELKSNRFDLDWELVIKAIRRGCRPVEVDISYTSRSFIEGKKIKLIKDPLSWLGAIIRYNLEDLPN